MITETFTIKEMEAEISKNYSAIMGALLKYAPQYKKALVDLSTAFGSTIRFEVVNPNSPRRIVVVKEIPISEIGNLNTFITDPNEDLWEIKKAKEDYYIKKLAGLETGSLMKDATVWFDNKSMHTFRSNITNWSIYRDI